MSARAGSIYVDAVPGSQPTQELKLSPWSLYDKPELYDRVFGEREFDEEVSNPCLILCFLHSLKTPLSVIGIEVLRGLYHQGDVSVIVRPL